MFLIATLLFSISASALEDFPDAQLRQGFAQNIVARVMTELKDKQGIQIGEGFDPAQALAKCDPVDTAMKDELAAKRKLFYDAKAARERSETTWDKKLRDTLTLGKDSSKLSLKDLLSAEQKKWPCVRASITFCNDKDSLSLLDIVNSDPAILDETIMSTCIRTIKLLKKSGTCTFTQSISDEACKSP